MYLILLQETFHCSRHLFAKFKSIRKLNGRRGQWHLRHSKHKLHTRWLTETPTSVNQESALWQSRKINIPLTGPLQPNQGAQTFMKAWRRTDRLSWFGPCSLFFLISLTNFLNMSSWVLFCTCSGVLDRKAVSPWFTTLCFLMTLRRTSANYGLYSLILPRQSQGHIVQWRHYSLAANLSIKRSPPKRPGLLSHWRYKWEIQNSRRIIWASTWDMISIFW